MMLFLLLLYSQSDNKINYPALGDSYTIGESVEFIDGFSVYLLNKLGFNGLDFAMADIVANKGWTTDELNSGIENIRAKSIP